MTPIAGSLRRKPPPAPRRAGRVGSTPSPIGQIERTPGPWGGTCRGGRRLWANCREWTTLLGAVTQLGGVSGLHRATNQDRWHVPVGQDAVVKGAEAEGQAEAGLGHR